MSTQFPAKKPSTRNVTAGQYAVKRFISIAGTGSTRVYGSQPFNSKLQLAYNNISDEETIEFVVAHENARGSFDSLDLPPETWDGLDLMLRERLERDYVWRFASPPSIQSIAPGRSSVSIELEGQRDG